MPVLGSKWLYGIDLASLEVAEIPFGQRYSRVILALFLRYFCVIFASSCALTRGSDRLHLGAKLARPLQAQLFGEGPSDEAGALPHRERLFGLATLARNLGRGVRW